MRFEIDYIEKLVTLLNTTDLTELTLEDGEQAIVLRKEKEIITTGIMQAAAPMAAPAAAPKVEAAAPVVEAKKGKPVTSPMVGTFYKSPSPDAKPFVELGSTIAQGQTVCIIEAMKLLNEIESDVAGKVIEICVKDGEPVEFGQVIMYVE